jgi:hypothetical protein
MHPTSRTASRLVLLFAVVAALALAAPSAEACNPYVAGHAVCTNGTPAAGKAVTIDVAGSFYCGPSTFNTTTNGNGDFLLCTGCEGWTTITIHNEDRSHDVQSYTHFGTWTVPCPCTGPKCPNEQDPGGGQ